MGKYSKEDTSTQVAVLDGYDMASTQSASNKVEHIFNELKDIQEAFSESQCNTEYSDFLKVLIPQHYRDIQTAVWRYRVKKKIITFYDKYLPSFNLESALKNKVALIVDRKLEETFTGVQQTIEALISYGKIMIRLDDDIMSFISPYLYWIEDGFLYYVENKERISKTVEYYYVIVVDLQTNKAIRQTYSYKHDGKNAVYLIDTEQGLTFSTKFIEVENYMGVSDVEMCAYHMFAVDYLETLKVADGYRTQTTLHLDERYFRVGRSVTAQGFYRIYNTEIGEGTTPMFNVSQPQLRFDTYNAAIDFHKQEIANALGINANALGIRLAQNTLATVAILEEETTMNNVNAMKKHLTTVLKDIDARLDFGEYKISSPTVVADMASKLRGLISTEALVKLTMPNADDEARLRETILLKIENGKMLTLEEEQYATTNGLLGTEVETLNNYE